MSIKGLGTALRGHQRSKVQPFPLRSLVRRHLMVEQQGKHNNGESKSLLREEVANSVWGNEV